jgi:outer membrane protein OmpA-like peptidoglycan-associated protein
MPSSSYSSKLIPVSRFRLNNRLPPSKPKPRPSRQVRLLLPPNNAHKKKRAQRKPPSSSCSRSKLPRQQAEQQAQNTQQQLQQAQDSQQRLQQQVQQAQTDKEQMRQRLLGQLNQVLETKDSARGLIVNMPDVLFNVNSANLKPEARERLAKVAGILIAYPDIRVEVDGYTDNTGSLGYNQQLSEQRADAVRGFLVQQGVPSSSVGAKGFGPNDPVASNDSPEGRQQNRRVNLIVSGESIGAQLIPPGAPSQ